MLNAVLSDDLGPDLLTNVMRPWLLQRASAMKEALPKEVLEELVKRYEEFKAECPGGRTEKTAFAKIVLRTNPQVCLKLWYAACSASPAAVQGHEVCKPTPPRTSLPGLAWHLHALKCST